MIQIYNYKANINVDLLSEWLQRIQQLTIDSNLIGFVECFCSQRFLSSGLKYLSCRELSISHIPYDPHFHTLLTTTTNIERLSLTQVTKFSWISFISLFSDNHNDNSSLSSLQYLHFNHINLRKVNDLIPRNASSTSEKLIATNNLRLISFRLENMLKLDILYIINWFHEQQRKLQQWSSNSSIIISDHQYLFSLIHDLEIIHCKSLLQEDDFQLIHQSFPQLQRFYYEIMTDKYPTTLADMIDRQLHTIADIQIAYARSSASTSSSISHKTNDTQMNTTNSTNTANNTVFQRSILYEKHFQQLSV
jgi:hypothetical protein